MENSLFIFKGYASDTEKGEIFFYFTLQSQGESVDFTEKISFPPVNNKIPPDLLKSLLDNLMLILGISYWKIYCSKIIELKGTYLTKDQARFWNTVYTKGLGEFFYKNNIDFRGLVNFPSDENAKPNPVSFPRQDRSLLLLGGGKDSIVSGELLKEQKKPFDALVIGGSAVQNEVSKIMGKPPITIYRRLDNKLFELNKKGAYNGHVPISVVYAFLGLMAAIFYDYKNVIVSNEKSANYGNVKYLGQIINHQWSKSEEFEKLFQMYASSFITPDVHYFSFLRSFTETEIAQIFSKYKRYFKAFSSCNTNFKIKSPREKNKKWCGKCAKCLFVFSQLSAFVSKDELLEIFGKNLFNDKALLSLFKELLGIKEFKPFECVGTPDEMKIALDKTYKREDFNRAPLMEFFIKNEITRSEK